MICKAARERREMAKKPEPKRGKCKNCGENKVLTNQGLCYDCLYIDSHYR